MYGTDLKHNLMGLIGVIIVVGLVITEFQASEVSAFDVTNPPPFSCTPGAEVYRETVWHCEAYVSRGGFTSCLIYNGSVSCK